MSNFIVCTHFKGKLRFYQRTELKFIDLLICIWHPISATRSLNKR